MKIKILIDLRRFFSNAQRRSLTSELSEDQNHINFPDVCYKMSEQKYYKNKYNFINNQLTFMKINI